MSTSTLPPSANDSSPDSNHPADLQDAVIRLAGNSQDGIQSIGGFLARLAGRTAQDVMTYMTIPSTISGGPSIFQVHIGSGEILSAGDEADFLVAFYQHSYEGHIGALREGGICLYDSDHVQPNLEDKKHHYVGVPITVATVEAIIESRATPVCAEVDATLNMDPADLAAKVVAREKDIRDGKFVVKIDDNQPKATVK